MKKIVGTLRWVRKKYFFLTHHMYLVLKEKKREDTKALHDNYVHSPSLMPCIIIIIIPIDFLLCTFTIYFLVP